MSLVLYNTLSGQKEELKPLNEGLVRLYVCGPTVYDDSHIGHARAVVVFDTLVRHLRRRGYQVLYVRNFTDLDDKIIKRANEEGINFLELAERYIESFHRDMDALGALRPDHEPRATEHIDGMIADVKGLIERGHAYQAGGDVYYDVTSFPGYGRLSGRTLEDMKAGARIEVDERKKNPWDFALWKESKPGEPFWPSPWGDGRPGWHIECSAMSDQYLGETFDIHGGGYDLVFPHHENEIAQAAGLGRGFARVWVHNGFVRVDNQKMSKSLKNFFTIKEVLDKFEPETVRLFLISKHYRSPIDFSDEALAETRRGLDRAYRALAAAQEQDVEAAAEESSPDTEALWASFGEALDDDLNTARALGHLYDAVRELNRRLEQPGADGAGALVATVRGMGRALGILGFEPSDWFSRHSEGVEEGKIEALVQARSDARARKDWAEADRIRDELTALGVVLEDAGGKTRWRIEG